MPLSALAQGFHGRGAQMFRCTEGRVVASVRVRRLARPVLGRPRSMFRERLPGAVRLSLVVGLRVPRGL
ncbi:hypothetical protein [Streptomyces sp. NPDC053069]|uniref:hypothetical protein n=1 Tax=Streptomyces sp. NPDC053069 TaxID=3365695 RepID=UPI0037CE8553